MSMRMQGHGFRREKRSARKCVGVCDAHKDESDQWREYDVASSLYAANVMLSYP